jgi:hypothetical protein
MPQEAEMNAKTKTQGSEFWCAQVDELDDRTEAAGDRLFELQGQRGAVALDVKLGHRPVSHFAAMEASVAEVEAELQRLKEMRSAAKLRLEEAKQAEALAAQRKVDGEIRAQGKRLEAACAEFAVAVAKAGEAGNAIVEMARSVRTSGRPQKDWEPLGFDRITDLLAAHAWQHIGPATGNRIEQAPTLTLEDLGQGWLGYLHGGDA